MNSQQATIAQSQFKQSTVPLFRLPKEHGATVAFCLSSLLCLYLTKAPLLCVVSLITLCVAVGLSSRLRQSKLAASLERKIKPGMKQTFGMAVMSAAPLMVATLGAGLDHIVLAKSLLFVACTLLSTAVVQLVARTEAMNPAPAFSLAALLVIAATLLHASAAVALLILPLIAQVVWLRYNPKPSFKALGIAGTMALIYSAVVICSVI